MKTCRFVLAALICVAPFATAQDPEIPRVIRKPNPGSSEVGSGDQGAPEKEIVDDSSVGEVAGKVEVPEPVIRNDLAFHMAPVLSFQPRRIAPGAAGDAHLVLSMQRDSVLQVGGLDLQYPKEQGPVRLGEWTIGEPAIGLEPGPFRGRPVYESYAQVVIPIAVVGDAAHGSYPILIDVIAEVTDGRTGVSRGESRSPARAELSVGPPLATPYVPPSRAAIRGPTTVSPAPDVVDDQGAGDATADAPDGAAPVPIQGARREGPAASAEAGEGDGGPAELPVDRGGRSMLWIGGGAGFLLLIVGLLALRRR